ncbi:MAG: nucleotidyltransferase domain-containing protein, partial [Chloroflexi bacterium]|nr:nucleotidyltransferase domain-containing protein [Chloroflexota bacterium]
MTAGTDLHPEVREVVDRLVERLGDDLKAVLWHGSWARGEARPDSDHDLIIILKRVDDGVLLKLRDVFFGRASWSTLIQSEDELRHYPLAGRIQFTHGLRLLYGE